MTRFSRLGSHKKRYKKLLEIVKEHGLSFIKIHFSKGSADTSVKVGLLEAGAPETSITSLSQSEHHDQCS